MTKQTITRTPAVSQGFACDWRAAVGPGYQFPVAAERLFRAPANRTLR